MVDFKYLYQNENSAERTIRSVLVLAVLMVLMVVFLFGGKVAAQENYADWKYSANCTLNTNMSASGGGSKIDSNVYNIPILIRLNAANFNFSLLSDQVGGKDLRFAKSDGTHLPYEIEHCNPATPGSAEIWVKVDMVRGNDSTQYIKMYWGKASPVDSSNSAKVFELSNGFVGVYHLNENAATKAVASATGFNPGTSYRNTDTQDTTGVIKGGLYFHGDSDFVSIRDTATLDIINEITIEGWLRLPAVPDSDYVILSKSTDNGGSYSLMYMKSDKTFRAEMDLGDGVASDSFKSVKSTGGLTANTWYYAAATYDKAHMKIYLNGALCVDSPWTKGITPNGSNLFLGQHQGGVWRTKGTLDEVRVQNIRRSPQWIKLCYENQNATQSLVRVGPAVALPLPTIAYDPVIIVDTIGVTPSIVTPTLGGGAVSSITIYPPLPTGLSINSTTGIISGTPTTIQVVTVHTITTTNGAGTGKDTFTLSVVAQPDRTPPSNNSALTLNALSTSQISVMWKTPESQSADADSVLVLYSSVRIPATPFDTILGVCQIMGTYPVGTTPGTANYTLSGLTESKVYHVALFVRDAARNYSRSVANTVTTRGTNDVFNPLVVHGRYADSNHIAITISNFSTLDTTVFLLRYVDSIGVWYNAGSFLPAPVRGSAALVKYSIRAMIANNTGGVFSALLPVPVLTSDTVYCISAAPFWRPSDSLPLFVAGNGDRVLMRDTVRPLNSLTVAGQYLGGDSVMLTIGNLASLDTLIADSVLIWHGTSDTANFTDAQFTLHLSARTIRRAQTATYTTTIKDRRFKGLLDTVYAVWLQVGKNSLRSVANDTFFTVGTLRPQNPLALTAAAISPTRVQLSWNAPAAATDSVRLWYGTAGIPKSGDIPAATFRYVNQPLAARIDTIDGLQSNTIYYFAMQVYHSGLWSLVTAASSDTVLTLESIDTNHIVNTVDITELVFDTVTNEIRVRWQVDTTLGEQYVGIQYGIGSYSLSLPTAGLTVTSAQGEMVIALREPLRFDTTYYVSLWAQKVDGQWSNPTPLSKDTVRIAAFKWQAISYFNRRVSPDTVRAYNGRIVLFNDPAYDLEVLNDVLDRVPLNSTVTGFIPISTGFKFRNGYESLPFNVGFAYDTALARVYGAKSIRMYRMVLDSLRVEDNTFIDSVAGIVYVRTDKLVDPFIAAIDTVVPTITILSNDTTIYILGKSVQDTIRVSDNIGNVKWRLEVGKGGDALRIVPPPLTGNTVSGNNGIINTSVGTGYIDNDNGVRILLITSDGVHTDTINLSRQVVRPIAETFTIPSLKWRPIYTAAMIDNPISDSCLWGLQAAGETAWKFDIKRYRVFRWYETAANKPLPEKWVELADSNKQYFSFVPGRLMWVKTAAEQSVVMGRGVTMSLRKNYTGIKLPPHSWTDFGLPFRFGIALSDILAATGSTSDSLEWYGWQIGADSMYAANPLYVPGHALPALRSASGVTLGFSGYTVYNRRSDTVTLKVPPIPKGMSRGNGAIAKVKNTPAWCLSVITCNSANQPVSRVECGYLMEKGSSATVFMVPPSFASVTTAITDEARTGRYGHKIYHQPQDGGYFFDVVFSNKSAIPQTIRYTIAGLSQLPLELRATIIRNNSSIDPSDTITVTLAANAELHELIAVGDAGYLAKVNNRIMGLDLVLGSIYPNPVGRTLTIRYNLPFSGVSAVQFEVYDVAGRMVWSKLIKNGLRAGANTFAWDTKQTTLLSRRLYILRMKAIDEKGNTNKVMVHTFTYWGR